MRSRLKVKTTSSAVISSPLVEFYALAQRQLDGALVDALSSSRPGRHRLELAHEVSA